MDEPPLQRMAAQIDQPAPDAAAFLDGLSDEDLALFAESLAVQRELEAEDAASRLASAASAAGPDEAHAPAPVIAALPRETDAEENIPGVLPLRRPRIRPFPVWGALAAAAIVLLMMPVAWLTLRDGGVRQPSDAVAMLADPRLPPGYDTRAWSGTRGEGDQPADQARAAQLGAFVVDLQLAIRDDNVEAQQLMAARAADLLDDSGNAGPAAARRFREIGAQAGGDREALLAELAAATEAAERAVDHDHFALGAWAEAALVAIDARDSAFFRSGATRATLRRAARRLDADQQRTAIETLRAAVNDDPLDWDRLRGAVKTLFRTIA